MFQDNRKSPLHTIVIILTIVFIVGYTFFQARKIVSGPKIIIERPINGEVVYDNPIEIIGKARNINSISMNDRPIFIDEAGVFKEKLLLYLGYNIVEVYAKDRFGKETTERLEIVLQNPNDAATTTQQN